MDDTDTRRMADVLFDAWRNASAPPLVSAGAGAADEARAYRIQAAYLKRRIEDDRMAGFKAGATAPVLQQVMGLQAPMTGVLLGSGERASGALVGLGDFSRLLIETEIGFRAAERIDAAIDDLATLQKRIPRLFAAFELADTGFYGASRATGVDLIAANAACGAFICGPDRLWRDVDPDRLTVTLRRDGATAYQAGCRHVVGSQAEALRWLVNAVVAQGYVIEPGQIFLTGALGQPQAGAVGRYRADFGPLGEIDLEVG